MEAKTKTVVYFIPHTGQDPQQLEMYAAVYGWEIRYPDKTKETKVQTDYAGGIFMVVLFCCSMLLASAMHYYHDQRDRFYHSVIRITLPVVIVGWALLTYLINLSSQ